MPKFSFLASEPFGLLTFWPEQIVPGLPCCCLVHQLHLLRAWRGLLGTLMSSHLRNQPLNMTSSSCILATKSFWTERCFGNPEPGGGCSLAIRYLLWSLLAFASSSQNVVKKRWLSRLSFAVWQIIPKLTDLIFYDRSLYSMALSMLLPWLKTFQGLLLVTDFQLGIPGLTVCEITVPWCLTSNRLELPRPEMKSWMCHLLLMWPWASSLTSMSLWFPISKRGIALLPIRRLED